MLSCRRLDPFPSDAPLVDAPAGGADIVAFPSARTLSDREAHAVAVGRADAFRLGWDASLPRSRVRRAIGRWLVLVTGVRPATGFADERLEELRLFAGMMRRDDRRADAVAERLLRLGYSRAALRQAITLALA